MNGSPLSTSELTYILGGVADTWGRTWSISELSNANFRVRITDVAGNTARDFFARLGGSARELLTRI
ncbi:MAG TPA: hypothetical protein VJH03_19180 [Blastocatellia bacterium]|nr:hypothetical protein [Blastocatellia bacterium]